MEYKWASSTATYPSYYYNGVDETPWPTLSSEHPNGFYYLNSEDKVSCLAKTDTSSVKTQATYYGQTYNFERYIAKWKYPSVYNAIYGGAEYYCASACVRFDYNLNDFCLHKVKAQTFNRAILADSTGNVITNEYGVRVCVELSPNVTLTSSGTESVWNISI